jgi:hypothetical protein
MDEPAGKKFSYSASPTLSINALVVNIKDSLSSIKMVEEQGLSFQYGSLPDNETQPFRKDEHATALPSSGSAESDHLRYIPLSLTSPSVGSESHEHSQSFSGRNDKRVQEVIIDEAEFASRNEYSLSESNRYDWKMTAAPLSVQKGHLATIFNGDSGLEEPSENDLSSLTLGSNENSVMQADRHLYNQNNNNGFNSPQKRGSIDSHSLIANTRLEKTSEGDERKWSEDIDSSRHESGHVASPSNATPRNPTFHQSMPADMSPGQLDARPITLPGRKARVTAGENTSAPLVMKHHGQVLVRPEQQLRLAKLLIKTGVSLLEKSEKHFYLGSSVFGKQNDVSDRNLQKHLKIVQEDGPANGLHLQFKRFAEQFGAVEFQEADWTNSNVKAEHKARAMKRCVLRIKQDLKSALKKGDFQFESAADGEVTAITLNVAKKGCLHSAVYRIPFSLKAPGAFSFEMNDMKDLHGEPIRARVLNIEPLPLAGNRDLPFNSERTDELALEHAVKWEEKIRVLFNHLNKNRKILAIYAHTKEGRIELKKQYDEFYKLMTEYGFSVNKAEKNLDEMLRALKAVREPLLETINFFKTNDLVLKDKNRIQEARQLKRPYTAIWVKAQRPRATRGIIGSPETGYQVGAVPAEAAFITMSLGYPLNLPRKFILHE